MTDVVVERLRIACRTDASGRDDALAVRHRLDAVARHELPRALDSRGRRWGDLELESVCVELDFDPRAYDDATIAVLWADRIAAAVEREVAAAAFRAAPAREDEESSIDEPSRSHDGAAQGSGEAPPRRRPAGPWATEIVDAALAGDGEALLRLATALDAPELRRLALDAIPAGTQRALARLLEAAGAAAGGGTARAPAGYGAGPSGDALAAHEADAEEAAAGADRGQGGLDSAARRLLRGAKIVRREAQDAEAARDRPSPPAATVLATSCAGLVLAYPWLASLLADAAEARPRLDPVVARRHALAALAGELPAGVPADDDPLVLLLAGHDLAEPAPRLGGDPEPEHAAAAADQLLGRVAAGLPGFARSSPAFIRRELVVRAGTLDPAADPVPVLLAPAPLDVVVRLLPYPLGIFRLPWTDDVAIRLQED